MGPPALVNPGLAYGVRLGLGLTYDVGARSYCSLTQQSDDIRS